MQFFKITPQTKLSDLSQIIGQRNVDHLLAVNDIQRTPRIGEAFQKKCEEIIQEGVGKARAAAGTVDWQRKSTILNKFCQDSDVFEQAALSSEADWKVLSKLGTFPMWLKVPETITLPDSTSVMGNGIGVAKGIYDAAMRMLEDPTGEYNHTIDPVIFNDYSAVQHIDPVDVQPAGDPFHWFKLPWGDITLYSSLAGESIDFPVYPEEYEDSIVANYQTMPDLLYQYEPWQIYTGSGPRQNKFTFKFHRDMWSGNHLDGKANQLIRFCEANCYPEYNGSAVNTSTVTLYIKGKPLISGIMLDVTPSWSGPIGQDGFYLYCELSITIVEVSQQALNFETVRNKPLIG